MTGAPTIWEPVHIRLTDLPGFPRDALVGTWDRPEVRLRNGWLINDATKTHSSFASPRILADFVSLSELKDEKVFAFARQYGPLGLCQHGQFLSHSLFDGDRGRLCLRKPYEGSKSLSCEHPDWWRVMAGRFQLVLNLAVRIDADPKDPEINPMLESLFEVKAGSLAKVADPFPYLVNAVNDKILRYTAVSPWLDWRTDLAVRQFKWHYRPFLSPLASVLSVALAMALSHRGRYLRCSECRKFYSPKRVPTFGVNTFCPRCRKHAAWRAARRKYYRNREKPRREAKRAAAKES